MLPTTIETIRSILKCDTTLNPADRSRILAALRSSVIPLKAVATSTSESRLVRRAEAAKRLGCSLRLVDRLAHDGVLPRRKLPGRRRAAGFLESDLDALIVSGSVTTSPSETRDQTIEPQGRLSCTA
jgi:excisionase family DNA binding protein